jgi:hypothetical protein
MQRNSTKHIFTFVKMCLVFLCTILRTQPYRHMPEARLGGRQKNADWLSQFVAGFKRNLVPCIKERRFLCELTHKTGFLSGIGLTKDWVEPVSQQKEGIGNRTLAVPLLV